MRSTTTADGRRLLIIHGDELDTVIQNVKWLAYIGDVGYQFLAQAQPPRQLPAAPLGVWVTGR